MVALSGKAEQRPRRARRTGSTGVVCACLMAAALLAGCSLVGNKQSPPTTAPRVESPSKAGPSPKAAPAAKRPQEPSSPAVTNPPLGSVTRVAIVYADNVPVYRRIAERLAARIHGRAKVIPLHNPTSPPNPPQIADFDQVVAIGARAARSMSVRPVKQLVFCQVFNYRAYGLTGKNVRGVSMLPPVETQFKAWKRLAPDLKRIGVITGPGHDELIGQARNAARGMGMELVNRIAHSDKETLFEFKRLVPDIDGIWLLPDDRILSHRVLRELMTYSTRHRKQVVAFTPDLLRYGAVMSASGVETDIVDRLLTALRESADHPGRSGFQLLPLTEARIETNAGLLRQLGYTLDTPANREGGDER